MGDIVPTFEEIKAKAVELYIKEKGYPPTEEPQCMTLKTTPSIHSSYWARARKIIAGKVDSKNVRAISHMNEEKYMRPKVAATKLGVSYKTLWRWWKEGKIEAIRLPSGRLRYPRDEIERILGTRHVDQSRTR